MRGVVWGMRLHWSLTMTARRRPPPERSPSLALVACQRLPVDLAWRRTCSYASRDVSLRSCRTPVVLIVNRLNRPLCVHTKTAAATTGRRIPVRNYTGDVWSTPLNVLINILRPYFQCVCDCNMKQILYHTFDFILAVLREKWAMCRRSVHNVWQR